MNETWPGLAIDGNLESVDVFPSWINERECRRVDDEQLYFNRLFENNYEGVITKPFPEVARAELIAAADPEHWPELVDQICVEIRNAIEWSPEKQRINARTPRPHQVAALKEWRSRGRRGILKHATGSGKTFTALCAIEDALGRAEIPLILVPSELLLQQWMKEVQVTIDGARLLKCGAGYSAWRDDDLLRAWTRPAGAPRRLVLATMQTARSEEFISQCRDGTHLFFVADEVHRLGATKLRRLFDIQSGPRLGLSATPERAGDEVGTQAILEYFEGIVPPLFTLADAVASEALTPYVYYVHRVSLDHQEQTSWNEMSTVVRQLYAQLVSKRSNRMIAERLQRKLIERARVVKGAGAKVGLAAEVIRSGYRPTQRWIVYCDDQRQLGLVMYHLREAGIPDVYEYHSAMLGDREATLRLFEARGGVVVSIRCLDEGVDIPSVTHALILASSRNPREYIQRRGRVLRRAEGKTLAHVHDVLVTPRFDPDEPTATAILEGELVRAIEFGRSALNPGCITDLERLAIEHGIDLDAVRNAGVEEDEEEG
jgi:superfamily II DNA or RNA helicase